MENRGGSRPGVPSPGPTPRRDTARSESHFLASWWLGWLGPDATDVSDISDAGRFVDEFDADDKQDVRNAFRAVGTVGGMLSDSTRRRAST